MRGLLLACETSFQFSIVRNWISVHRRHPLQYGFDWETHDFGMFYRIIFNLEKGVANPVDAKIWGVTKALYLRLLPQKTRYHHMYCFSVLGGVLKSR